MASRIARFVDKGLKAVERTAEGATSKQTECCDVALKHTQGDESEAYAVMLEMLAAFEAGTAEWTGPWNQAFQRFEVADAHSVRHWGLPADTSKLFQARLGRAAGIGVLYSTANRVNLRATIVKVLPSELVFEARLELMGSAQSTAMIPHAVLNLCGYREFSEPNSTLLSSSELYYEQPKEPLALFLKTKQGQTLHMDMDTWVEFAIYITRALKDYAEAGFTSGEISPTSIMHMFDGSYKLSEFASEEPDVYVAPEQLVDKSHNVEQSSHERASVAFFRHVTPACDVWAIAVVLVRAWHSQVPFEELTLDQLRDQYRMGYNPCAAFMQGSDMPHNVKDLLSRCLMLPPGQRISASDLCNEMQSIAPHLGTANAHQAIQKVNSAAQASADQASAASCAPRAKVLQDMLGASSSGFRAEASHVTYGKLVDCVAGRRASYW